MGKQYLWINLDWVCHIGIEEKERALGLAHFGGSLRHAQLQCLCSFSDDR